MSPQGVDIIISLSVSSVGSLTGAQVSHSGAEARLRGKMRRSGWGFSTYLVSPERGARASARAATDVITRMVQGV